MEDERVAGLEAEVERLRDAEGMAESWFATATERWHTITAEKARADAAEAEVRALRAARATSRLDMLTTERDEARAEVDRLKSLDWVTIYEAQDEVFRLRGEVSALTSLVAGKSTLIDHLREQNLDAAGRAQVEIEHLRQRLVLESDLEDRDRAEAERDAAELVARQYELERDAARAEVERLRVEMADEDERMTRERHETGMELARLRLEVKLLRAQVAAVRALHYEYPIHDECSHDDQEACGAWESSDGGIFLCGPVLYVQCAECRCQDCDGKIADYPCATIRALDGE